MSTAAAILSMVIGLGASATLLVLLMAGGANASPAHVRILKWLMLSVGVIQLSCLAGGIWLLATGRPWPAAGVAAFPIVYAIGVVVVMVVTEF